MEAGSLYFDSDMTAKQRLSIQKEQKENLCLKISKQSSERDHYIVFHRILFKNTKITRIALHTFEKHKSANRNGS